MRDSGAVLRFCVATFLLATAAAACGGGGGGSGPGGALVPGTPNATPTPAPAAILSTTVPVSAAQGGTVSLADGSKVVIAPGQLTSDANVTLVSNPQTALSAVPGWGSASGDLTLSLAARSTASAGRRPAFRALSSADVDAIVTMTYRSSSQVALAQGGALVMKLSESDGGSVYFSPDQTIDQTRSTVSASIKSSVLSGVSAFTATEVLSDASYTPPPTGPITLMSQSRRPSDTGSEERILVLVHGLFGNVTDTFGDCASQIGKAGHYNKVVGFNYDWTLPPDQAAQLLTQYVNSLGQNWIDIEAHSYGTDVTLYALPNITVPVKNLVLLNGPLPYGGVPVAAVQPRFLRTIVWNLIGLSKHASLQQLNAAQTNHMLDSLAPASGPLVTIANNIQSRTSLPRIIEVGGTKPFSWEAKYPQLFDNGVFFAGPYDGIVELTSANSADFLPLSVTPRKTSFPDDHYTLPCDGAAISFVAGNLSTPPPATPTPGPPVTPTPGPPVTPTPVPVPNVSTISPTAMLADGNVHTLQIFGTFTFTTTTSNVVQFMWTVPPRANTWNPSDFSPSVHTSNEIDIDMRPGTVTDVISTRVCRSASQTLNTDCSSGAQAVRVVGIPTNPRPGTQASPGPTQSSRNVTLSWDPVPGATAYGVGVRDIATDQLVVSTTVNGTSYVASLSAGRRYRWDVTSCLNGQCLSNYTTPLYFQTP